MACLIFGATGEAGSHSRTACSSACSSSTRQNRDYKKSGLLARGNRALSYKFSLCSKIHLWGVEWRGDLVDLASKSHRVIRVVTERNACIEKFCTTAAAACVEPVIKSKPAEDGIAILGRLLL